MSEPLSVSAAAQMTDAGAERRLHPLTLLLNLARQLPQAVIGLIALRLSGPSEIRDWVAVIAFFAISALLGLEFWKWWRFSYRLDPQELRIASGILNRNVRSIPYERIQDVNLEQGLLARMLGMARVRLETGSGGSGDEGVLDAIDLAEAERLRDVIRLRKALQVEDSQPGIDPAPALRAPALPATDTPAMFVMDSRRVLMAGVFNFSLVFFALIGALLNNVDFLIPDQFWEPRRLLDWIGLDDLFATLDFATRVFSIIAALLSLLVIGLLGGIIRTFLREHDFRLDRTETGFRRRRGLITLTDVVMPLHRIQAAVIESGPVRRRLGWYALKVQSLASDSDKESDHAIAPLARADEVRAILAETTIRWDTDHRAMRRVDPAMWWVPTAFILPIPIIGIAVAATLANPWLALLYALLPLAPVFSWLHWHAHRYALEGDQLYVRDGSWNQRLTLLPLRRVQSVDINQTVISRFIGLAEVAIGVAGRASAVTVQAIPLDDAIALRARLLALS